MSKYLFYFDAFINNIYEKINNLNFNILYIGTTNKLYTQVCSNITIRCIKTCS